MEIDLLSASQIQVIQDIADTTGDERAKQSALLLLQLNQGANPDQLSGQFNLPVEEIESLRRSFLESGLDIFPGTRGAVETAAGEVDVTDEVIDRFIKAKTPEVHSGDKMSEAGRKILGFHFARMVKNEPGARLGEDIEALHDMRVATRRMRVAFELFTPFFKKKSLKPHLEGLRSTGRALGSVRDLDVLLEQLKTYLETLPEEEHPAFEGFISQWEEKREKAQSKMIRFLDGERYRTFVQQFDQFLNTAGEGEKRSESLQPSLVREIAPILIYERVAVVRTHEQVLGNATVKELHALRLQLKKLRYILEFFEDVLGSECKEVIRDIKTMQDHLGNLNDADVACQIINAFIAGLENDQAFLPINERVNPEPILTYLAAKYDLRHRLIITTYAPWEKIMGRAFSENLAKAISVL